MYVSLFTNICISLALLISVLSHPHLFSYLPQHIPPTPLFLSLSLFMYIPPSLPPSLSLSLFLYLAIFFSLLHQFLCSLEHTEKKINSVFFQNSKFKFYHRINFLLTCSYHQCLRPCGGLWISVYKFCGFYFL